MSNYLNYKNGLGTTSAYQVSGKPFALGNVVVPALGDPPMKVEFPSVTSWFSICNRGNQHVRLGFSEAGVQGINFYCIHEDNHPTDNRFDLKVTEVYLVSDTATPTNIDIVAGLTSIDTDEIQNNWSGSLGVG